MVITPPTMAWSKPNACSKAAHSVLLCTELKAKPVAELTPEQQRKYDYFFLEAARLKIQKDYDAAFDLLQHCLTINPNASSALYELAQYYLFLKQVPQGQAALEKAVENDPDNYWYSQGLANLYQQQDEKEKAMKLLEDMSIRFTDMDGIENHYTVSAIEVHDPTDVEAVEHSGHDLVLYTCTYGGKTRIVVFCDRSA